MTWHERARASLPGGVNSPVRAFRAVGGEPPFISSARGSRLTTTDGQELIDFIASWGAIILGHARPEIVESVQAAAGKGLSFGVSTHAEVELAELLIEMVPSLEMVRMVNSGTEATASAIRLARAATGRNAIITFAGGYHGHADPFLAQAGSGLATFGEPSSPGVPPETVAATRVARYNDLASVEALLDDEVAAVIMEPVAGNMGCIPPRNGFLAGVRDLCDRRGALLVFDEVMTGFRVGPAGAQGRYGVTPDLTTLGKVIAGGAPAAAYGGRRDLMAMISPEGPVYQAGTLAGNPLATAAGLATLRYLAEHAELYTRFDTAGDLIRRRVGNALDRAGIPGVVHAVGGMVGVFLGGDRAEHWDDVAGLDTGLFARFHRAAFARGVLLPPSAYEAWFLMEDHLEGDLDPALESLEAAIAEVGA
jgi:glutamate-1-semialdehyde 2,1-aminomutase